MTEIKTNAIPHRLKNVNKGHPYVAGAGDIYDDVKGKSQADVNKDVDSEFALHQSEINALNSQNYVTVDTYAELPATGSSDTIYRVCNWDGAYNSGEGQVDSTKYTEYAWAGTEYRLLSVKSGMEEVFDVSQYNASGGSYAIYTDLEDLLTNHLADIPVARRKGGMSIKFIQGTAQSTDNKYVQYRLMADSWSTTVTDWQGVDDEPTAGSNNLVESGGVANVLEPIVGSEDVVIDTSGITPTKGILSTSSNNYVGNDAARYNHINIPVIAGRKYVLAGNGIESFSYAFVKSAGISGDAVDLCSGATISNRGKDVTTDPQTAPSDAVYLVVNSQVGDNVATPTVTLKGVVGEIEKISTDLGNCVKVTTQSLTDPQKAQALSNLGISGIDNVPVAGSNKLVKSGGVDSYFKERGQLLSIIGNGTTFVNGVSSIAFVPGHTYRFTILNSNEWEIPSISDSAYVFNLDAFNNAECAVDVANNKYSIHVSNYIIYRQYINGCYEKSFVYTLPIAVNGYQIDKWYLRLSGRATNNFELFVTAEDVTDTYNSKDETSLNFKDEDFVEFNEDGCVYGLTTDTATNKLVAGGDLVGTHYKQVKRGDIVKVRITGTSISEFCTESALRLDTSFTDYYTITNSDRLQSTEFVIQSDGFFAVRGVTTCVFLIKNKGVAYRTKQIENVLSEIIDDSKSGDKCALLDKKLLLNQNRDYYFDDTWSNETSYIDTSYLDRKISEVPEGKHFIFLTDSHIDYSSNGQSIGPLQDTIPVVKYVRDRMGIKNVIFGGDCIGAQTDSTNGKYQGAKVLSVFTKEMFESFGSDFIWVMGNHDTNAFPAVSVPNKPAALISDVEVYKRTTKAIKDYGKAIFPTKLLGIIDNSDDILDYAGNALTQDEKDEFKAWVMQNYCYDDDKQKIRYIVLETGDSGNTMRDIFGDTGDPMNSLLTIAYFVVECIETIPDGYDLVVLGHMAYTTGVFWYRCLWKLLYGFKNKESVNIMCEATSGHENVNTIVSKTFDNPSSISSITIDLSTNSGSGRVFFLSGHYHSDKAVIVNYRNDWQVALSYPFALTTDTTPQSKAHDGQDDVNYSNVSILSIRCDRCCAIERGSSGTPGHTNYEEGAYSYPNDLFYAPADRGPGEQRLGTIKEVLFDVVTITPDNRVVLTRFGAEGEDNGLPYVRDYVLPTANN